MNPYLGEIRLFSYVLVPKGWATCAGQLLSITQNQALFAVIGTTYGGNGVQTFALPDLRGRVPVDMGNGPGGTYDIGQFAGEENVTLLSQNLPQHNHNLLAVNATGGVDKPINNSLANSGTTNPRYAPGPANTALNPASIQPAGGGLPHTNIQPYLAMSYCIALQGIFPDAQLSFRAFVTQTAILA